MGQLSVLNGTGTENVGAIIKGGGWKIIYSNCYYLDGIQGNFKLVTVQGDTVFKKDAEDENTMTSEKVVQALNNYIDAHKDDEDESTNTSKWLKWQVGSNGLPELIF